MLTVNNKSVYYKYTLDTIVQNLPEISAVYI